MSNNNTTTTTGPESDVRVNITVGDSVLKATMLDNETARDFRLMTIGPAWTSTGLKGEPPGSLPRSGWPEPVVT